MRILHGKSALVTGAASGIGRALALRLAAEGMRLYLLDVDEAGLTRVVDECRPLGVEAIGRRCDLAQRVEISAAVAAILDRWGRIDLLVNNAGITYYGRTVEMTAEHWDRLLAVNLHAPVQLVRELLPSFLAQGEAHILNVGSVCGLVGLARVAAYSTSKFAMVGFSESLRSEYSHCGLGVTVVCPGFVDTNLFATGPLGPDRKCHKIPPRWLMTTPETIAARAVRGIRRNRGVVVVQPYAHVMVGLKRFAPWALEGLNRLRRKRSLPGGAPVAAPDRRAA